MSNMDYEQLEAINNLFRNNILQTCWKRKWSENKTIQFTCGIMCVGVLYSMPQYTRLLA